MKLKFLIVDDEYSGRASLAFLLKENNRHLIDCIDATSNMEEAVNLLGAKEYDICFLDIQLHGNNGFDLVGHVPESTQIVYVTAFADFAIQAIKNRAFDYLLKPINPHELQETISKAYQLCLQKQKTYISIKEKGATIPIKQVDILLAKANGPYSEIQLNNGRVITTAQTLKSLEQKLNGDFIRVHKSFLIHKNAIASFNKQNVFFENNKSIPLSRTGLKILQELFSC